MWLCVLQEKLGPQCMRWLEDQVASIREAATKTLQKIAQVRHTPSLGWWRPCPQVDCHCCVRVAWKGSCRGLVHYAFGSIWRGAVCVGRLLMCLGSRCHLSVCASPHAVVWRNFDRWLQQQHSKMHRTAFL